VEQEIEGETNDIIATQIEKVLNNVDEVESVPQKTKASKRG
jgi:hypothetical protein